MGRESAGWWTMMSALAAVMMTLPLTATAGTHPGSSNGGTTGVPSAVRHTRTLPSSPPLMMTGCRPAASRPPPRTPRRRGRSAARRPGCRRRFATPERPRRGSHRFAGLGLPDAYRLQDRDHLRERIRRGVADTRPLTAQRLAADLRSWAVCGQGSPSRGRPRHHARLLRHPCDIRHAPHLGEAVPADPHGSPGPGRRWWIS